MPWHRGDDLYSPEHAKDQRRQVRTLGYPRSRIPLSSTGHSQRLRET
jgi:hypothetical protein